MEKFIDNNNGTVYFTNKKDQFDMKANHVLVVGSFEDKLLLTNHKKRGLEFPGGKRELKETIEDAAKREVFEETGAIVNELKFFGEYKVTSGDLTFVKAIFFTEIQKITKQKNYFETNGPVLVTIDELKTSRFNDNFSFIMKDKVTDKIIEKLIKEKSSFKQNE